MRQLAVLTTFILLLGPVFADLEAGSGEEAPPRGIGPDLMVVLNIPLDGGSYQKELGLYPNVTVTNIGDPMGPEGANVSVIVRTIETPSQNVYTTIPVPVSGLGSGENVTLTFKNWTQIVAGRFVCNATIFYPQDVNRSNNYAQSTFSVWSDYYPFDPKFGSGSLSDQKGDVDTEFEFTVDYVHNKLPSGIRIEIDGINRTMMEDDPEDDVPEDGKLYTYTTKLPIGNHKYRFFGETPGFDVFKSPFYTGPWVNVSLKDHRLTPTSGYVTTDFLFMVNYGSDSNLPPDRIFVIVNGKEFNLSRSSPTPNYQSGLVEFSTRVKGIEMIPSPITYGFSVTTGPDSYTIGPFKAPGPKMRQVNLTGTVTDIKGASIEGATVKVEPGPTVTTDSSGYYSLVTYVGRNFKITYSKNGYLPRTYEIDMDEDRNLDIELEPLPVGGTVTGKVSSNLGGTISSLKGAKVNISGYGYGKEVSTDESGFYTFEHVPSGNEYTLRISEFRHQTQTVGIQVQDGRVSYRNVTMLERNMNILIDPDPEEEPISVDQTFILTFPSMPDPGSIGIYFVNGTGSIEGVVEPVENTTDVLVTPESPLNYFEPYAIILETGVMNSTGVLLVWRNMTWDAITEMQPISEPQMDPQRDAEGVPLDTAIRVWFQIGLNRSSVQVGIMNLDDIGADVDFEVSFIEIVNWSRSGFRNTVIRIDPVNLSYLSRYSVEISPTLKDQYGRNVMDEPLEFGFRTVNETDSDGDGVPDSLDAFRFDITQWMDTDGDGYGDNPPGMEITIAGKKYIVEFGDMFPNDKNEWMDTDGDGIGDNSDEDDDNDGMDDQWELDNGLDPNDPSDAFEDADGDGYSNLDEYLAGTDPQDRSDHPEEEGLELWIIITAVALVAVVLIGAGLYLTGVVGDRRGKKGSELSYEE
ncbi:MAG: carboxypeptidase regulatory-like domain-containing protein [Thermoplasmatota archaeon]